ncbi:hypothetical protein [uncultured Desulfosarcina sp.]|uniref:hypothetical protein n=1 Tax=uncultured Desulfosarcina sp. TaxID=218289 RepID=UPI0029C98E91|nr:hypothetical protein [uncultured Desulfosarcina sp.]
MDGRQKPDPQQENKNDLNDDEIIDLTHVVAEAVNDDIIDLTEVLEQPDSSPTTTVDTDETPPSLQDAAPAEAPLQPSAESDDDIIDLTDLAVVPEASDVGSSSQASEDEPDDDIIDLMDVATPIETEIGATGDEAIQPTPEDSGQPAEEEEEIIDLLEVTGDSKSQTALDEPEVPGTTDQEETPPTGEEEDVIDLLEVADIAQPQGVEDETDDEFPDLESRAEALLKDTDEPVNFETPQEAVETAGPDADFSLFEAEPAAEETEASESFEPVGVSVDEPDSGAMFVPATPPETPVPEDAVSLTEEQIETALTRTIEKIYGEKIEQLMLQTIEKTVKREIEKIKNALLDDSDGMSG